eukprot:TRINITY_DN12535_c0_g1_i1.p1 TRINITY_DN12535_c0_g1~~TRINITY_DN12535_c0_g1_i1.p1  ORF type:complete len:315 (+),score=75.24 TRINITY_DN12535_c0_g1_i1:61-1005(+)
MTSGPPPRRDRRCRSASAIVAATGAAAFAATMVPSSSSAFLTGGATLPRTASTRHASVAEAIGVPQQDHSRSTLPYMAASLTAAVGAAAAASASRVARGAASKTKGAITTKLQTKDQQAALLESVLLTLFQADTPDIFRVRDCLTRLARLDPRPNSSIAGEWMIFWASKEGCVDQIFGTETTIDDPWKKIKEYMIRFTGKKQGRFVEGAEIVQPVGPFPNRQNSLFGKYAIMGTTSMRITFDDVQDDEKKAITFKDGAKEKVIDLNVIYASKRLVAMQWSDESGECDFFVLTPVEWEEKRKKLLGQDENWLGGN